MVIGLVTMSLILWKLEFSINKIIVTSQQSQVLVPYFSSNIWICLPLEKDSLPLFYFILFFRKKHFTIIWSCHSRIASYTAKLAREPDNGWTFTPHLDEMWQVPSFDIVFQAHQCKAWNIVMIEIKMKLGQNARSGRDNFAS